MRFNTLSKLALLVFFAAAAATSWGDEPVVLTKEQIKETKALLKQFKNAQAIDTKAVDHRLSLELKEFDVAQKAKRKEFHDKETLKRRKYFEEHPKGPDRREYMKGLLDRRKDLEASLKDERTRKIQEQGEVRLKTKQTHEENLKKFEEKLSEGERPSEDLWPPKGH